MASELLNIYSIFADTNADDTTPLNKVIGAHHSSVEDSNIVISNEYLFETINEMNVQ